VFAVSHSKQRSILQKAHAPHDGLNSKIENWRNSRNCRNWVKNITNQNAARPTASKFWVPQSSSLLCATHRHSTVPPAQHFGVTRMLQSNLQRRASITTFVSQIVFNGVTDVFAEKVPVIIMYESSRLTIQNKKIHWAQHADHFNRSDYLFHKS
jgi:hypothetical protein